MTQDLAQFTDRYTMHHQRTYPHPIERVWAAVTTPEHMDKWMLPFNSVEPWQGGTFGMTFGGPADQPMTGEISIWDPPSVVEYSFGPGNDSVMRFELETVEGGTRLTFVHSFPKGVGGTAVPNDPGGDLPGGPDTPWRPGFVAGFHIQMDSLSVYLEDPDRLAAITRAAQELRAKGQHMREWVELCKAYRQHIIDTIPGGVSS